jgi:transcriptional regulator of nitric oxide reductase
MNKKGIIVIAIIALIVVVAVVGLNLLEKLPPEIIEQEPPSTVYPPAEDPPEVIEQEPPYRVHLRELLANTGLTFVPIGRNDFVYYRLHSADKELAGFVFLGTEEGWGGPINLFVKTDAAGIIQDVYVWHHTETPIFVVGMDDFLATFVDYKAEAELIWQEDVHGITGATVTAEAIIGAIHGAGRAAYQKGIFMLRG